jgi:hypothetical protein
VDLRVGGRYRFSGRNADGSPFEVQKLPTLVEITP